jgi:Glycosyl transferase family 2
VHAIALLFAGIGVVVWLLHAFVFVRARASMRVLERLAPPAPGTWPSLSIVVPARNEEAHIEAALRSKLAQDYPDLEVVAVNDRSTDGTGAVMERVAAEDPRLKVLHVSELPSGWLGKLHAMHLGVEASNGDWILLSDADVHLAPGTMRKAVAFAEAEGFDHVAALPSVWSTSFGLDAAVSAFLRSVLLVMRVWDIENPRSTAAGGCGAFNLMRRAAYRRSPGLSWLRLEVGDDVALGQILKASGARSTLLNGRNALSLQFYPSLRAMAKNLEKTAGVLALGPTRIALGGASQLVGELAPLWVLAWPEAGTAVRVVAMSTLVFAAVVSAWANRWFGQPTLAAMWFPLGTVLSGAMTVRAGVLGLWRGGIYWRGTFYSFAALRGGARLQV